MTSHVAIQPKILYYGTPVVLLTTLNEDGSTNISPISSSWALGHTIVLGIGLGGKAMENLGRHPECVINIPDATLWRQVEALAPLTGMDPIPEYKRQLGFRFEKDKFAAAGLTQIPSEKIAPCRIKECPLQIEAQVKHIRIPEDSGQFAVVETEAVRVHAHTDIVAGDHYVNPQKWNPLIYNFRHYFGLGNELGKTFRAET
ncbi:flavin reductase family protein [Brevibacillus sp. H7]|uniref:flavin reductase family protein n=1 Tax=Brevibacillus sp. H7 TaxID=3349138 RepID=UPI00381AB487